MNRKSIGSTSLFVALFCAGLFFVSLWLPAIYYSRDPAAGAVNSYWGGALLLLGWLETLGLSVRGVAWLANPFYFLGTILLLCRWYGWASLPFAVAAGLAAATFSVHSVLADEGGNEAVVTGLGPGFWLWFSAILISLCASLAFWIMMRLTIQKER